MMEVTAKIRLKRDSDNSYPGTLMIALDNDPDRLNNRPPIITITLPGGRDVVVDAKDFFEVSGMLGKLL
mgnify:FL=1